MAKQRKEIHKVEMTDGKRAIIQQLFQEYNIEKPNDIQDALKDLLGGTIKEMMESEIYRLLFIAPDIHYPIKKVRIIIKLGHHSSSAYVSSD